MYTFLVDVTTPAQRWLVAATCFILHFQDRHIQSSSVSKCCLEKCMFQGLTQNFCSECKSSSFLLRIWLVAQNYTTLNGKHNDTWEEHFSQMMPMSWRYSKNYPHWYFPFTQMPLTKPYTNQNIAITDCRPSLNKATVHTVNPYHKVSS